MKKDRRRRLPWVLMLLGAALALCALGMLSQTRDVLQYNLVAPEPGEKGETYVTLAQSGTKLGAGMKETLAWAAVGGTLGSASVSAADQSEQAALWAVGEGWLEVYPRFVTQGRRIGESELAEGARVAMLDEDLAFKLFGEELPPDASVKVNDVEFQVVGAVRHAGSLLGGRGVGDGTPYDLYVPLVAAARAEIALETLSLSGLPQGGAGAAQLFVEAAESEWKSGGELVDLKKEAMRRTILPRILLLIVGLYALVGLFARMTRLAESRVERFRQALKGSYLRSLIPQLLGLVALILIGYGALIGLTYLLLVFSSKPLYVFTEWVPENIVEWSSISKVFWSLTADAARLVRVGSRELRVVEFWGGVLRWGMILVLVGAALRGKKGTGNRE